MVCAGLCFDGGFDIGPLHGLFELVEQPADELLPTAYRRPVLTNDLNAALCREFDRLPWPICR